MSILVIDGYNVIGTWKSLKEMSKKDMGSAREQLVSILASFYPWCWERIIVVFDGQNYSWISIDGIEVVYTSEKETADTMIEKLSAGLSLQYEVIVATSDSEEYRAAYALGARVISSESLAELIDECRNAIRQSSGKSTVGKGIIIHDLINQCVKESLEKMRRK